MVDFEHDRVLSVGWSWTRSSRVEGTGVEIAKQLAVACESRGWVDVLRATNWVSLAAGIEKQIEVWMGRVTGTGGGTAVGRALTPSLGDAPSDTNSRNLEIESSVQKTAESVQKTADSPPSH